MASRKLRQGFTLVELLVVIAIIEFWWFAIASRQVLAKRLAGCSAATTSSNSAWLFTITKRPSDSHRPTAVRAAVAARSAPQPQPDVDASAVGFSLALYGTRRPVSAIRKR